VLVVVVLALGGAYDLVGNAYASARVANVDDAIGSIEKIDFTTTLFQVSGGLDPRSTSLEAKAFQSSVKQFVDSINTDRTNIAADLRRVRSARNGLGNPAWLMLLDRGSLDAAGVRIAHAQKSLDAAATIVDDMSQDGNFFSAYATALTDFEAYTSAEVANDNTTAAAAAESAKSDLATTLQLTNAPGLPAGLHDYVAAFETVAADIVSAINSVDEAAYQSAIGQLDTDSTKLLTIDTSGFDASIEAFYQPMIVTYDQELKQASD